MCSCISWRVRRKWHELATGLLVVALRARDAPELARVPEFFDPSKAQTEPSASRHSRLPSRSVSARCLPPGEYSVRLTTRGKLFWAKHHGLGRPDFGRPVVAYGHACAQ